MYWSTIHEALIDSISAEVFNVWCQLASMSLGVFGKLASSSAKYHKRSDGTDPTNEQHTALMVKAAIKIVNMLGEDQRTNEAIILAVAVHDIKKYGLNCELSHTTRDHGTIAANWLRSNAHLFDGIFTVKQFEILVACVQYHNGIWSTDPLGPVYDRYFKYIQFVHMLDMLESRDLIRYNI